MMRQRSIKINALLNVIRQSMSIVFPLITYPYVSRVLGADNLGRYSFSDSIVQIVITVSLIGIPTYAVREGSMIRNSEKEIQKFCSEVFTIHCISVFFSYALLLVLVFSVKRLRIEYTFILILSINIMSRCIGRDWINTIYEEYLYISLRFIAIHVISLLLILTLVKEKEDLAVYVAIMAFSEFMGNILNLYYTKKKIPYRLSFSKDLFRHIKPILILFCSSIATTIYIRSDITILGFLRPDSDIGVYTVSSKIYTIVKSILNAVITVSIPRLSFYLGDGSRQAEEKYNELLNHLRNVLILLLFPATAGLFCLSNDAMCLVGGVGFQWGGTSLRILCVAMVFAVLGCFFAHAVLIVNRQEKVFFKATFISALLNISLNFVLIPSMGINGAALTTMLSELCIMIFCGFSANEYFKNDRAKLYRYLIPTLAECILIFIVFRIVLSVCDQLVLRILLTVLVSMMMYLIILVIFAVCEKRCSRFR